MQLLTVQFPLALLPCPSSAKISTLTHYPSTSSACCSLKAQDQVSDPYKTMGSLSVVLLCNILY